MNNVIDKLYDHAEVCNAQNGISFTEEQFTNLVDEVVDMAIDYKSEISKLTRSVNVSAGTGIVVGAVGTGLVILGVHQFRKFRKKRKLKVVQKEVAVTLEKETFESEVVEIHEEDAGVGMPKKDMGDLAKVIMEINKHEKK